MAYIKHFFVREQGMKEILPEKSQGYLEGTPKYFHLLRPFHSAAKYVRSIFKREAYLSIKENEKPDPATQVGPSSRICYQRQSNPVPNGKIRISSEY